MEVLPTNPYRGHHQPQASDPELGARLWEALGKPLRVRTPENPSRERPIKAQNVDIIDVPNSHWLIDESRALKLPLEQQLNDDNDDNDGRWYTVFRPI